jgi:uncharacterized protein YndB with AHSA1/START domain
MTTTQIPQTCETLEINKSVDIAAPIEVAFEALLDELGPEALLPDGTKMSFTLEAWPGGRWFRDLGKNTGHLWGHVQVIKPPTLLEICGPLPMSYPAVNHLQYRLTSQGSGTRLTFVHRGMGMITPDHRENMPKGWGSWIDRIRQRAERK